MKKCPKCAESVQDDALICKHCGTEFINPKDFPGGMPYSYWIFTAIYFGLGTVYIQKYLYHLATKNGYYYIALVLSVLLIYPSFRLYHLLAKKTWTWGMRWDRFAHNTDNIVLIGTNYNQMRGQMLLLKYGTAIMITLSAGGLGLILQMLPGAAVESVDKWITARQTAKQEEIANEERLKLEEKAKEESLRINQQLEKQAAEEAAKAKEAEAQAVRVAKEADAINEQLSRGQSDTSQVQPTSNKSVDDIDAQLTRMQRDAQIGNSSK
jgi:hypothetical protein